MSEPCKNCEAGADQLDKQQLEIARLKREIDELRKIVRNTTKDKPSGKRG